MTTRKTYTAEFKPMPLNWPHVRMSALAGPHETSESVPPCSTAGDSRLRKLGQPHFQVRPLDPDPTGAGNPTTSERERDSAAGT